VGLVNRGECLHDLIEYIARLRSGAELDLQSNRSIAITLRV
jgi:hypothetical protein